MDLKYFTIYGERCSGTNFLENAIKDNFNLEVTWDYGWKHFFGNYNFDNSEKENQTLFIGIIREPIEWLDSFYKEFHHIPYENRTSLNAFLFNEFYSIEGLNEKEIIEDRNMLTKERYKNIFELRSVKNNFLIFFMHTLVKNFVLVKYEDLNKNYDDVLNYIHQKFNLNKKNDIYNKVIKYKGDVKKSEYIKKEILLSTKDIDIIIDNLNIHQENILGYLEK